jgi:uncharacterized protein
MKAVDTNILVYAHRNEAPQHIVALTLLRELGESSSPWAIPWPCISEFYSVVTNTKIWKAKASSPEQAIKQLTVWSRAPGLKLLSEVHASLDLLTKLVLNSQIRGPAVHDARIVALCLAHGVSSLYTADRDFSRFPQLRYECPW